MKKLKKINHRKEYAMKRVFLCVLFVIYGIVVCLAQFGQSKTEVGIMEHLEDVVPLDLSFVNEYDDTLSLREIIDKPVVLSFVYFDCPGLCNPLLDGINEVVDKVDLELGKDYKVVTISFNYADTPEKAKNKKKNFSTRISKDNAKHWNYLTGDSLAIERILEAVGYRIKKTGVDWIHPSAIILLSPEGKITRYLYGTSFLPFDLKMAVSEASQGVSRPTINRVLEYCFSYDPQGQKYSLQVTKVAATIIIAFALLLLGILMIKPKSKRKKTE